MSKVVNLKKYKQTKAVIDHFQLILKIVDLSIKGLDMFSIYTSVYKILAVLKQEKTIIELHLKRLIKEIE